MSEFTTYWPVVAAVLTLVGGITGFFIALLRIKQLKLSVTKLEDEVRKTRESIHRPTPDEIEKYGKALENFIRDSEYASNRYKDIVNTLNDQLEIQHQVEHKLEERSAESVKLIDELEHRIHRVHGSLNELINDLGKFNNMAKKKP